MNTCMLMLEAACSIVYCSSVGANECPLALFKTPRLGFGGPLIGDRYLKDTKDAKDTIQSNAER